jgi:hypothetical protein
MEALFFTPNIITCTHPGLMQSIRDKVKNCMILSAKAQPNGHGSSVVEIDHRTGLAFRLDRNEFLCAAALLGWFDETDRLSVRPFLTDSQNTLLQHIMQFRTEASRYAGPSFDEFSSVSCGLPWYDVVNRHNQHFTKRLFFHARMDSSTILPRADMDMNMQEDLEPPLAPDAGDMPMETDQVPGQQDLQLQPSQAPHPALPVPIEQQQREPPRTLADGSGEGRADRKPARARNPVPEWAIPGCPTWRFEKLSGLGQQVVRFEGRRSVMIGREPGVDVQLPDTAVFFETSRLHVLIAPRQLWSESRGLRDQVICIQDQDSRFGTFVNNKRLPTIKWTELTIGDRVRLGRANAHKDASVEYQLFRDPVPRPSPDERAVQAAMEQFAQMDMLHTGTNARQ